VLMGLSKYFSKYACFSIVMMNIILCEDIYLLASLIE
jgi:hypothetical protein